MKYELREGIFGRYTLYVEQKYYDGNDPHDYYQYKKMRKATKEERLLFHRMMNNRRVCNVI